MSPWTAIGGARPAPIIVFASTDRPRPHEEARNPLHPRSHADDSAAARAPRGARGRPLVRVGPRGAQPVSRGSIPTSGRPSATVPRRCCARSTRSGCTTSRRTRATSPTTAASCRRTTRISRSRGRTDGDGLGPDDLVAYFCAEFGFHESLPIYSGGLGILAGDHCKAASDARLPFVGVGLLYRQGYFFQTIDGDGNQQATYHDSDFDALPIQPRARRGRPRGARQRRLAGPRRRGQGLAGARGPRARCTCSTPTCR